MDAMISLQRLLGKDDRFFDLLNAAAEEARQSVLILSRSLGTPSNRPTLEDLARARRSEKRITQQISEALVETVVTHLEREDIEMLSETLYKIPKIVEKFAERFSISEGMVKGADFSKHIELLGAATTQVVAMVNELSDLGAGRLDKVKAMNARLQEIESEADELILELLRELWSGRHDTTKVIVMKDLYELLEKGIDRCRDAGKAVTHITLKNS
ncbi:MAG TPA: DUF47 family protein [Verrucomicrobiae bacterium]|nr:DUF47 family protein [Verrucomicrobiae bacterium]